jgi:hypothetical protein
MDAFDDGVDGEHLDTIPFGLDNRRIVADADEQPRRREGQKLLDPCDQLALGPIRDRRHLA